MKLVLIQGTYLARYDGRQQKEVVKLECWNTDHDFKSLVEDFRVNGIPNDVQAQQG